MTTIILGLDPGLATTGFGVIKTNRDQLTPIAWGAITTSPNTPLPDRLHTIYTDLQHIIATHQPIAMAIESLFFNTNARTALLVGQARGVCLLAAKQAAIPTTDYTPLQIKQGITGYGRADKTQIQYMVTQILGLTKPPEPDDVADALGAAICHAHSAAVQSRIG